MKHPIIKSELIAADEVQLELDIPDSIIYFQGHFPDYPLLPGVVQVHWAEFFGRKYFSGLGQFSQLESIKFHAIITPNSKILLTLKYNKVKQKLVFCYTSEGKKHSSGRIVLDK